MTFIVQEVSMRKTKAGNDYLLVKIGDKLVSFFEAADVAVPVEAGQAITCVIKQVGRFWNGYNLAIASDEAGALSAIPEDIAQEPSGGFSQVVNAGNRTYYVDVKVAKNGERYMTITERATGNDSHRIMVFSDHAEEVVDAILKARDAMK